jgi:hypothetical protein
MQAEMLEIAHTIVHYWRMTNLVYEMNPERSVLSFRLLSLMLMAALCVSSQNGRTRRSRTLLFLVVEAHPRTTC